MEQENNEVKNIHWVTAPTRRSTAPTIRFAEKKTSTGGKSHCLMLNRPAIELLLGTKNAVNVVLGYADKAVYFKICDEPDAGSYQIKMPKSKASHTTITAAWLVAKLASKLNTTVKLEMVTREVFKADFDK